MLRFTSEVGSVHRMLELLPAVGPGRRRGAQSATGGGAEARRR